MAIKRAPLSVDEILQTQKQQKEESSKPKFLTKAERQALALQRREEELREQRAREARDGEERERFEAAAREVAQSSRGGQQQGRGGYAAGPGRNQYNHNQYNQNLNQGQQAQYNDRFGNHPQQQQQQPQAANRGRGGGMAPPVAPRGPRGSVPSGPRGAAQAGGAGGYTPSPLSQPLQSSNTNNDHHPPPLTTTTNIINEQQQPQQPPIDRALPQAELEIIRARYLGSTSSASLDARKRRAAAASSSSRGGRGGGGGGGGDKKFVFDWDEADDTSVPSYDDLSTPSDSGYRNGRYPGHGQGAHGHRGHGGAGTVGTTFGGRLAGYDEGGSFRRGGASAAVVGGGAGVAGAGAAGGGGAFAAGGGKAGPGGGDKLVGDYHADSLERRRAARSGIDDRHWTEKPLTEMKDRDWRIFREDFSIATRGGSIPHPLRSWRESTIPPAILDIVEEIGYKEPSPIQRQAIPIGQSNRDLIGIAQTGSGKTAAFVIPMLEYISHLPGLTDENRHLGPYALIMAPTRELAQQIEAETKRFAIPLGYTTVSIVGGRSVEEQQFNLRNGAEIIIATPGRLKDLIDRNMLVLSQCRYVVMDEADRMVDLGFEQDLTFILNAMPEDYEKPVDYVEDVKEGPAMDPEASTAAGRQGQGEADRGWKGHRVTTLFSATMPPIVERLAKQYLRRPATVVIGNAGEAVDTVEQRVEFIAGGEDKKKARLQELLRSLGLPPPMIVFVNEKKTADQVVRYVQAAGKRATTLHSGKNQEQREAALQSLRDGDVEVLVATDLAGRGIDVPDVTCVINWQMASTIEKYVHRIGRTGRAGKTGLAITFLGPQDEETMYDLKQELARSPLSSVPNELAHHPAARQRITREMKRKRDDHEE
ncbi:hypothetical protein QFC21_005703 [Naganishia friedmannii]|uniref:Uncharacterized protein n=1 Tax=Naganishia friedmannii TaxID=89922 RepID=A0ACC2V8M5_9TREE|nr:hypothetical protein QFC21_005703 [Naganishia friedmannii]